MEMSDCRRQEGNQFLRQACVLLIRVGQLLLNCFADGFYKQVLVQESNLLLGGV